MTKKLSESSLLLTQEELQKHILGMTLFNDLLARAVLEDKEACEHILRILTGIKTLVIKKNKTQYVISKLSSHNIIMDVLAEDANNKLYEIEIQKADGGIAHEKRMLYYASTIINEYFFKGDQTYASVPELHIFYISQTDIGIIPTIAQEACGLSCMEYMMLGKCLITTNNGGQAEYVENGVTGLLVTPGDAAGLTAAIRTAITTKEAIGKKAKEYFDNYLSYGKFYAEILRIYKNAIK